MLALLSLAFAGDPVALTVSTTAFAPGETIPLQHTCSGADQSPPLTWTGAPPNTTSFAVIVDDPEGVEGMSFRNLNGVYVLAAIDVEVVDLMAARSLLVQRSVWEHWVGSELEVESADATAKAAPTRTAPPKPSKPRRRSLRLLSPRWRRRWPRRPLPSRQRRRPPSRRPTRVRRSRERKPA